MVLKDIMGICGQSGLFRFIAQGKNAIIVEHLETKKRTSAFSSSRVSSLEEISVFTEGEDLPLGKVLDKIHEKENGGLAIDYKSDPEKLKSWFEIVLPEYDRDKVYVSDIRKIAQWYNILHKLDLLVKEEPKAEAETEVEVEVEDKVEAEDEVEDKVDHKTEEEDKGSGYEKKIDSVINKPGKKKDVSGKGKKTQGDKETKADTESVSAKKKSKSGNK